MSKNEITEATTRDLADTDRKLIELFDDLRKGSLTFLDDAGKQLVTLITVLYGIFFGVFSFTNAPQYLAKVLEVRGLAALTIIVYFVALVLATLVFLPHRYPFNVRNLSGMRTTLEKILETKSSYLRWAYIAFVFGTFLFVLALIIALARL
jgi:hypothetical protein